MYGLLLDAIQKFLREKYGESYWVNIRRRANLTNHWFVTHEVYSDDVITNLVDAASQELGEDRDTVMTMFGEYFAENIGRYGYARLLRVLGRDLRDFLNGLDDLHEYLRFSYPNMRPPLFFCTNETPRGLQLHYTSKRKGFRCYVIGQLKTIGKIYGKEVEINVVLEEQAEDGGTHIIMDLKFDNREMHMTKRPSVMGFAEFQIDSTMFFNIFPFGFVFSEDMVIRKVGTKLQEVIPGLFGDVLSRNFMLHKPHIGRFDWNTILMHTNCTFELLSVRPVKRRREQDVGVATSPSSSNTPLLKLKGQMMLLTLTDIDYIAFLCSPAMDSPEDLYESGIFINDLSLHNCSREFIMAGSQKHPELNIALSQEKIRSAQLEVSVKTTDELLYQMIPKSIADKLRNGEQPLSTCQEFKSVSILFSDIVSFTPMCSRLGPMDVVCVLNTMCMAYDKLCEKYHVYKVEMIGDAYMVLAGGPMPSAHHAESITDYAFGIIDATTKILDPSTSESLKIRVGIHSGGVVAGVVGTTTQRYDVFGDTVNIAARMESTGEPMKIHVSEVTAALLRDRDFVVEDRGQVEVKGKGLMKTFWVTGKKPSPNSPQKIPPAVDRTPRTSITGSATAHQTYTSRSVIPGSTARKSSPAPDHWPQAERRLSKNRQQIFERAQQHRHTLASVDIRSLEEELRAILARRRGSLNSGSSLCPITALTAGLSVANSAGEPTSLQNDCHLLVPNNVGTGESGHDGSAVVSEDNLALVRESVAQGLPTISEDGASQLALFAAMAEENARNARRLADAAAKLVRSTRAGQLSLEVSSSVDPPLSSSSSQSRPAANSYCNVM